MKPTLKYWYCLREKLESQIKQYELNLIYVNQEIEYLENIEKKYIY